MQTLLVGRSLAMQQVRSWVARAAPHAAPVLLLGETGVGKDVVARALAAGAQRVGAYIPLNCGALATHLVESELFGHERGAFTGAVQRKVGAFEAAHRGTLFLDEVGELPLAQQSQLLRVLEGGEVRPVGTARTLSVDTRVVAATNRDLLHAVEAGAFRADLFHRLHVLVLELPPLRHRLEDLPQLAQHFLAADSPYPVTLSAAAIAKLIQHSYPGNLRELRNVLQRAVLMRGHRPGCPDGPVVLQPDDLSFANPGSPSPKVGTLQALERAAIIQALSQHGGNRKAAARALGVSRSTLHRRLHEFGLCRQ